MCVKTIYKFILTHLSLLDKFLHKKEFLCSTIFSTQQLSNNVLLLFVDCRRELFVNALIIAKDRQERCRKTFLIDKKSENVRKSRKK